MHPQAEDPARTAWDAIDRDAKFPPLQGCSWLPAEPWSWLARRAAGQEGAVRAASVATVLFLRLIPSYVAPSWLT
jgi:hypothetical protein